MGLETGSRLTVNDRGSDGTPQSMDTFHNPKNGSQTLFKRGGTDSTVFLSETSNKWTGLDFKPFSG